MTAATTVAATIVAATAANHAAVAATAANHVVAVATSAAVHAAATAATAVPAAAIVAVRSQMPQRGRLLLSIRRSLLHTPSHNITKRWSFKSTDY